MLEASCFGWDSTSFDGGADPNQAFNANSLESTAFKSNAFKSNKDFQETYPNAGGSNAAFQFSPARPYRGARRQALKADLIATLKG
jgi:diacylglycerol O-acyltransferase/trehalose O-mycolyltransferase